MIRHPPTPRIHIKKPAADAAGFLLVSGGTRGRSSAAIQAERTGLCAADFQSRDTAHADPKTAPFPCRHSSARLSLSIASSFVETKNTSWPLLLSNIKSRSGRLVYPEKSPPNGDFHPVIDQFLQDLPRKPRAENKEILRKRGFGYRKAAAAGLIAGRHHPVECRLRVPDHRFAAVQPGDFLAVYFGCVYHYREIAFLFTYCTAVLHHSTPRRASCPEA